MVNVSIKNGSLSKVHRMLQKHGSIGSLCDSHKSNQRLFDDTQSTNSMSTWSEDSTSLAEISVASEQLFSHSLASPLGESMRSLDLTDLLESEEELFLDEKNTYNETQLPFAKEISVPDISKRMEDLRSVKSCQSHCETRNTPRRPSRSYSFSNGARVPQQVSLHQTTTSAPSSPLLSSQTFEIHSHEGQRWQVQRSQSERVANLRQSKALPPRPLYFEGRPGNMISRSRSDRAHGSLSQMQRTVSLMRQKSNRSLVNTPSRGGRNSLGRSKSFQQQQLRHDKCSHLTRVDSFSDHSSTVSRTSKTICGRSVSIRTAAGVHGLEVSGRDRDCKYVRDHPFRDTDGREGRYNGFINRWTSMPHGMGRLDFTIEPSSDDLSQSTERGYFYDGDWVQGVRTGYGRLEINSCSQKNTACKDTPTREVYQGEFLDDCKHGRGSLSWQDGRRFQGTFVLDSMVEGTLSYQDGGTYQGRFRAGQRHGHGTYNFSDGSYYEGQFRHDCIAGHGLMIWPDGGRYEGEWRNGKPDGFGKEYNASGELFSEGMWSKGKIIERI